MQLDEKIACKGRGNHTEVVQAQKQAWNTDRNFILLQLKLSNMFDFRSFTLRSRPYPGPLPDLRTTRG